jgi:hypothetical protein
MPDVPVQLPPKHLFKYVSREVGKLVLANRTLRWSTPGTLNDPYDMQFDLQLCQASGTAERRHVARSPECSDQRAGPGMSP